MVKKVTKDVPVMIQDVEQKECYVTSDGREFEDEESASIHENLKDLRVVNLTEYFPTLNDCFELVYFENEKQVEMYEQSKCGNLDNNTWSSWVSQPDKFKTLPTWILCSYEHHSYGDDYTAFYYTLDEFKENLEKINSIITGLK